MAKFRVSIDVEYDDFNLSVHGPDTMSFGGYSKKEVKESIMNHARYICDQLDRISDED